MSTTKRLSKITNNQIAEKGVQALSNRPNSPAQYGVGGLSAANLKLWFDKLATFLAEKVNELQDTISGDEAADYIRILLDSYGVENLGDLVNSFANGSFANSILKLYPSAGAETRQSLQTVINGIAVQTAQLFAGLASLESSKLSKTTSTATYKRAYIINEDGTQSLVFISSSPVGGAIPLYTNNGQINVAFPTGNAHASNKEYTDNRDKLLGSNIELSIDPTTYIMTVRLKNTVGTVLSTATVDLPLESMIIGGSYSNGVLTLRLRNEDGHIDDNVLNIDISSLIDGLVSTSTYNAGVATLNGRIDGTNNNLQAFIDEIELSKIYAHAAFHAEESETARGYTKGGAIDRDFKRIVGDISAGCGMRLMLSLDSDYKLTIDLKNKKGEVISSGMVDLPIESLITNASYSNKILKLTFQSGQTLNVSIADIVSGLVPETRKVNGKSLTGDITLTADDVGAYGKSETYQKTEVGNLLVAVKSEAKQYADEQVENKQVIGYAYLSSEAEKAGGYIKGGQIDKEFTKIKKALASLNVSET